MWGPTSYGVLTLNSYILLETQSEWLLRAVAGVQEKGEVKRYSFNSTFPSLPSVMKARKRREDAPKTRRYYE